MLSCAAPLGIQRGIMPQRNNLPVSEKMCRATSYTAPSFGVMQPTYAGAAGLSSGLERGEGHLPHAYLCLLWGTILPSVQGVQWWWLLLQATQDTTGLHTCFSACHNLAPKFVGYAEIIVHGDTSPDKYLTYDRPELESLECTSSCSFELIDPSDLYSLQSHKNKL